MFSSGTERKGIDHNCIYYMYTTVVLISHTSYCMAPSSAVRGLLEDTSSWICNKLKTYLVC